MLFFSCWFCMWVFFLLGFLEIFRCMIFSLPLTDNSSPLFIEYAPLLSFSYYLNFQLCVVTWLNIVNNYLIWSMAFFLSCFSLCISFWVISTGVSSSIRWLFPWIYSYKWTYQRHFFQFCHCFTFSIFLWFFKTVSIFLLELTIWSCMLLFPFKTLT